MPEEQGISESLVARLVGSTVRHALTGVGAYLTTKGWVGKDDWAMLVTGVVMIIAGWVWSLIGKYFQTQEPA